MIVRLAVLLFLVLSTFSALAQDEELQLFANYFEGEINLDGVMDEEIWSSAQAITNFWQFFPTDSTRSFNQTRIKIVYNDETLFIGIEASAAAGKYVVSSLRRDFRGTQNDNVTFMFDTFSDGTNAFMFGVTPYGVQREALISNGGSEDGFNPAWDMKWKTESMMYDDRYVVEMAIPFTSLKFEESATTWRMQCYRWDFQSNEQSAWARVPQNQLLSNIAFAGQLHFEKPLGKSRTPLALIPYVNGLAERDFDLADPDLAFKIGGDAKIAIGDGLNLDLTLNPDFSNVEVDDIFTNLTRFELQLPEKRQFFIDNSDLFGSFGDFFGTTSAFFSRRIGLAKDTADDLIQNDIMAGARLSGKLNEDLRIGFLNIQTAADEANEIPANNNMMLALQQKVFARSNVGVFMINRQATGEYEFLSEEEKYNRVVGFDYNLSSADNVWNGKVFAHQSFSPDDQKGNTAAQAALNYNTRNYTFAADLFYVNEGFKSDLGFVPRTDILRPGLFGARTVYPKSKIFNTFRLSFLQVFHFRPGLKYKRSDQYTEVEFTTAFKNQSRFILNYNYNFTYLQESFDPTQTDDAIPIPENNDYRYHAFMPSFVSNQAKTFIYSVGASLGEYFNGHAYSYNASANVRIQPWANIGAIVRLDQIRLPDPHPSADLWLVTPRIDITFSKKLFWTTLIQYSNQRENLGVNSRLQWRYAPLSDLFLVYNDNYSTVGFGPKYRSINIKFTYWLNPF